MKDKLPDGMMKRGPTYYACFRSHGKLVRKRLSRNLRTAKQLLHDLRGRYERAGHGFITNDLSWDDLMKRFLEWAEQSSRMVQEYRRDLSKFEAYAEMFSVRQITPEYIIGYRSWRLVQKRRGADHGRSISPRTVNREVATLKSMLNKGVAWKIIGSNPLASIKDLDNDEPTKMRRALTIEEIQRLLAASPPWLRSVWRLFMTTGIRRDELINLRFDDIDFARRMIHIPATSKNHRTRDIPLDDEAVQILTELRNASKDRSPIDGKTRAVTQRQHENLSRDHVFVTNANTPLRNNLLRSFYECCKRAGIVDGKPRGAVDIHSLRGTFATLAIDHGASPKAVQSILGHSSLELTMNIYAKANDHAKRSAIAALPFASLNASEVKAVPKVFPKRVRKKKFTAKDDK